MPDTLPPSLERRVPDGRAPPEHDVDLLIIGAVHQTRSRPSKRASANCRKPSWMLCRAPVRCRLATAGSAEACALRAVAGRVRGSARRGSRRQWLSPGLAPGASWVCRSSRTTRPANSAHRGRPSRGRPWSGSGNAWPCRSTRWWPRWALWPTWADRGMGPGTRPPGGSRGVDDAARPRPRYPVGDVATYDARQHWSPLARRGGHGGQRHRRSPEPIGSPVPRPLLERSLTTRRGLALRASPLGSQSRLGRCWYSATSLAGHSGCGLSPGAHGDLCHRFG
jgi:hypothetical protein